MCKKRKKAKEDLFYWIDYAVNVGTTHLQHSEYKKQGFIEYFDLDMAFLVYVGLFVAFVGMYVIGVMTKILVKKMWVKIEKNKKE